MFPACDTVERTKPSVDELSGQIYFDTNSAGYLCDLEDPRPACDPEVMAYIRGFLDKDGNVVPEVPKKKQPLYQRVGKNLLVMTPRTASQRR